MTLRNLAAVLTIGLPLVACNADGPASLHVVAGAPVSTATNVSYFLFENPVDASVMTTGVTVTRGVVPGVACYVNHPSTGGPLIHIGTDASQGTTCAVVQNGTSFQGRAVVPASYVNTGYTIRIVLFWVPDAGWGSWE